MTRGYYQEEGLEVRYCWSLDLNLSGEEEMKESVNELSNKLFDVIFGTFNTVVYYNIIKNPIPLVALCGLTQKDVGALAVLKQSNIKSPKKLGGRKVGILGFPFEQEFIDQIIKSEGGNENIQPVLAPFQHLLCGLREEKYEACNIVVPWHGVKAQKDNVELNMFHFQRYGIPRHYPLLISLREIINEKRPLFRSFLRATRRGYQDLVKSEPREIAKILSLEVNHENMKDTEFLEQSLRCLREYFEDTSEWGIMKEEDWRNYVHFLSEKQLLHDENKNTIKEEHVPIKSLFDNEFLGQDSH